MRQRIVLLWVSLSPDVVRVCPCVHVKCSKEVSKISGPVESKAQAGCRLITEGPVWKLLLLLPASSRKPTRLEAAG